MEGTVNAMRGLDRLSSFLGRVPRCALAAIVVLTVCSSSPSAQEAAPEIPAGTFFEPLAVELVDVDAVVTDGSGAPITDLTMEDFEIFEDGRPVEITHFYAARGAGRSSGDDRLVEKIFLVLFLDDTNVDPQLRTSVVSHMRDILAAGLPPGVLTMLVRFDGSLHIESDFSENAEDVLAALDRVAAEPAMNPHREGEALVRRMQSFRTLPPQPKPPTGVFTSTSDEPVFLNDPMDIDPEAFSFIPEIHQYAKRSSIRYRASLEALQRFTAILGAMPGRTIMLWVGGVELRTGEMLFRTWQDLFPEAARKRAVNLTGETMQYDLSSEMETLLEEVNTDRISLFPVGVLDGGVRDSASMNTRILESRGRPGTQGAADAQARDAALGVMAAVTGGRRLTDNARLGEQLQQVAEELSSFYSLGYRPPSPGDDRYHEISVKVKREGADVRHRKGYRASSSEPSPSERTVAAALLGTGTNPLGINATCRAQEPRDDGTFLVPVAVTVPLGSLVLFPEGGRHTAEISVLSVVRDKRAGLSDVTERQYPIEIANEHLLSAVEQDATFVLAMALRRGPHRIAVTVRDDRSSVESTIWVDVDVGAGSEASPG